MVARNDITGDAIQTRATSVAYQENAERIFGKKEKKRDDDYWAKLEAETKARLESKEEK